MSSVKRSEHRTPVYAFTAVPMAVSKAGDAAPQYAFKAVPKAWGYHTTHLSMRSRHAAMASALAQLEGLPECGLPKTFA